MNRPIAHPYAARGMTIVEMLVGLALGLFVVSGAATLLAGQLHEQRALAADIRLAQDLRNAADMVARDLRRAGYWDDASTAVRPATAATPANPYAAIAPASAISDVMRYGYSRDAAAAAEGNESSGFRLHDRTVEAHIGGRWQALTDTSTLVVTSFELVPVINEIDLAALCPRPCSAAGLANGTCPPRQQVRRVAIRIAGHAAGNGHVVRRADTEVRLRNDTRTGSCTT